MHRTPPDRAPREPRPITADMAADAAHAGRFLRLFGAIFGAVGFGVALFLGVLFSLTQPVAALPVTGFGCVFGLAGLCVWAFGTRARRRALDLFRLGVEASARVTAVGLDLMVRINRRHPYRVEYQFEVNGVPQKGFVRLWVDDPPAVATGENVSVVYDPGDPSHNLLLSRVSGAPSARIATSASIALEAAQATSESEASRRATGGPRHP